jgi:hypothetical protein
MGMCGIMRDGPANTTSRAMRLAPFILAALVVGGCASRKPAPQPFPGAAGHAEACQPSGNLYDRQTNLFESVVVFKPSSQGTSIGHVFAPIFLQFGSAASIGDQPRRVAWAADSVSLGGQARARISYSWTTPKGERGAAIILDGKGFPMIWESLGESGARVLFVSRGFEAASRETNGAPLPGRRHASEPEIASRPSVFVARVLEDADTAMGPIIYISEDWSEIRTMICRCMRSQAKGVGGTRAYELVQSDAVAGLAPPKSGAEFLRLP